MVGIFLRLLEKHNCIIFLTTNRVDTLDEAFGSRISVYLKYDKLDINNRICVWKNLLFAANIKNIDEYVDKLALCEINGRQIKNTIRNAQAFAMNDDVDISYEHFTLALSMIEI